MWSRYMVGACPQSVSNPLRTFPVVRTFSHCLFLYVRPCMRSVRVQPEIARYHGCGKYLGLWLVHFVLVLGYHHFLGVHPGILSGLILLGMSMDLAYCTCHSNPALLTPPVGMSILTLAFTPLPGLVPFTSYFS